VKVTIRGIHAIQTKGCCDSPPGRAARLCPAEADLWGIEVSSLLQGQYFR